MKRILTILTFLIVSVSCFSQNVQTNNSFIMQPSTATKTTLRVKGDITPDSGLQVPNRLPNWTPTTSGWITFSLSTHRFYYYDVDSAAWLPFGTGSGGGGNAFLYPDTATGLRDVIGGYNGTLEDIFRIDTTLISTVNYVNNFFPTDSVFTANFIVDSITNTPPASPVDSSYVLVGASPTGVFTGHANQVAQRIGTGWAYTIPSTNDKLINAANDVIYVWNSTAWVATATPILNNGNPQNVNLTIMPHSGKNLNLRIRNQNVIQLKNDRNVYFPSFSVPYNNSLRIDSATKKLVADTAYQFIAGANITLTPNETNKTITISSTGGGGGSETWEQTLTNQGSTPFTTDNTVDFGGHSLELSNLIGLSLGMSAPNRYGNFYFDSLEVSSTIGDDTSDAYSYVRRLGDTVFEAGILSERYDVDNPNLHIISVMPDYIKLYNGIPDSTTKIIIPQLDSSDAPPYSGLWIDDSGYVHKGLNPGGGGGSNTDNLDSVLNRQTDPMQFDHTVDFGGHSLSLGNSSFIGLSAISGDVSHGLNVGGEGSSFYVNGTDNSSSLGLIPNQITLTSTNNNLGKSTNLIITDSTFLFGTGDNTSHIVVQMNGLDSSDAPPYSGLWIDGNNIVHRGLNPSGGGGGNYHLPYNGDSSYYLGGDSALHRLSFAGLSDVNISSVADGDLLKYDNATSKWKNFAPNYVGVSSPSNGDMLYYNGGWQKLGIGANNQYLISNGSVATWQSPQVWDSSKAWTLTPPSAWTFKVGGITTTTAPGIILANADTATSGSPKKDAPTLDFVGNYLNGSVSKTNKIRIAANINGDPIHSNLYFQTAANGSSSFTNMFWYESGHGLYSDGLTSTVGVQATTTVSTPSINSVSNISNVGLAINNLFLSTANSSSSQVAVRIGTKLSGVTHRPNRSWHTLELKQQYGTASLKDSGAAAELFVSPYFANGYTAPHYLADFGTDDASEVHTSKLTIDTSGNITSTGLFILQHPAATQGGTPSYSLGTGAGTGATASITGNDISGYITINTGTSPTAGGDVVTVTFSTALTNTPTSIQLTAAGENAAIDYGKIYVDQSTASSTSFKIKNISATALQASTTYKFYYTVTQ